MAVGVFVIWPEAFVAVCDGFLVRDGVIEGVKRGVKVTVGVREAAIDPGVADLALVPKIMIGAPEVLLAAVCAPDEEDEVGLEDEPDGS